MTLRTLAAFLLLAAAAHASLEILEVPALSSVRRLPDQAPVDALGRDAIHFIAAKGEFEPASFLIRSSENLEGVQLKADPLKGDAGVIPAANLDIKVVKVWYQDGTAWYSYYADPVDKELVPELLLNDENLIRVDHDKQGNFLRVGKEYRWISYPAAEAKEQFNYFTEPVADAATLQPISLKAGEYKQIWVTLKVPSDAAPGFYEGAITLEHQGRQLASVRVNARVLPFDLPAPKTYYDLNNPFFVSIYNTGVLDLAHTLGIPEEQAVAQQRRIYENLKNHNVLNPLVETNLLEWFNPQKKNNPEKGVETLKTQLTLLKETGMATRPLISAERVYFSLSRKPKAAMKPGEFEQESEKLRKRLDIFRDTVREVLGHTDIYASTWDEAGVKDIKTMREQYEVLSAYPDLKIWLTTMQDKHSNLAGYMFDYANQAGEMTPETAATWHAFGAKIANYASPHTGVENPDVYRRWEGLARYKANYDGSFNYMYYSRMYSRTSKDNVWNDSAVGENSYRTFNMVYPVREGVIDTLAWEGFREGIDDIRYATLLKQKAQQAESTGDQKARQLARKALIWLGVTDMANVDLNTVRLEMINYILELDNLLKKQAP